MKITCKYKPFPVVRGFLLLAAYELVNSFLCPDRMLLHALTVDPSDHELNFGSWFLAGLVLLGVLAGLFGMRTNKILADCRRDEEQFRNLVMLSNDIITITDRDGKLVFMNDAGCRILERKPEEVIDRSFMSFVYADDRRKYLGKLEELEKKATDTFIAENRFIAKSGKVITTLHTVRVFNDKKRALAGTLGIARDISEGKQSEESLQKALAQTKDLQARLESILSLIDEGIIVQDRDLKVLYQNQSFMRILGSHAAGASVLLEEVFNDGQVHRHEKEISGNRAVHFIEIKASPLKDASGNIVAGIGEVRDITAHKSSEERLLMFSTAVEKTIEGIQIIDLEGHIVYSNEAVARICGFSSEELIGKHISEMNADPEYLTQSILPQVKETGQWSGERTAVHKDGRTVPVWLTASVMKGDQGRPIAMIVSFENITERKQTEKTTQQNHDQLMLLLEERTRELASANEKLQSEIAVRGNAEKTMQQNHDQLMLLLEERTRELSSVNEKLLMEIADREKMEQELLKARRFESLGVLATGVAHDFNSLFASIAGNISLALPDTDQKTSSYRQLEEAKKASLRAQDLALQLLTLSKGDEPIRKAVAIGELIREVTGFAERNSRIKFLFSLPEGLWLVDVDEGQIRQVIHNLIMNADQSVPRGGRTITISCENNSVDADSKLPLSQGNYVRINIRDHGVGIPQEQLSKIFDPYFTAKQKGSGIGLALAHSIISRHNGHITAESETGKGTIFIIYLPVYEAGKA